VPDPVRVLAVLGRGVLPIDTPILTVDDLGALRGDGIFETLHVRAGRPWLRDEHLARLARSAQRLELALPDRAALVELTEQVLADWDPAVEGTLRLTCTPGVGRDGPPTVFAVVGPVGAAQLRGRREGVTVATASLGVPVAARSAAPWLLGGAKTLSYAVNMASLRWAAQQGADDVLWLSTEGYVLEAPTSTLVWLAAGTLWTVPAEPTGILPGTTARWLLDHAPDLGFTAGERLIQPDELAGAKGVWLLSSVRGAAEVRAIDGVARKPAEDTERILDLLGFPR
jgi:4-amino-4-deoxychorismate lyase